jgi:type IV secretion system protein VirB5
MKLKKLLSAGAVCVVLAIGSNAHASGIPIFDGAAAVSNAEQMAKWVAQIQEMKNQLDQAKQTYSSMTGSRGLGNIMNNPALKNYIPADWQKVYDSVMMGDAEEKLIVQQERELSSKRSNAVKMPN